MPQPFSRVLLKVSGEAIRSNSPHDTVDEAVVDRIAAEIATAHHDLGTQFALVVGGGNIWRGAVGVAAGMNQTDADNMGMLATVINALAFKDALRRHGYEPRVMSGLEIHRVCEPWIAERGRRHLEKGRVVICAAGIGEPDFTTDTAAVQRAIELEMPVLFKGTHNVDGVYSADPHQHPDATLYDQLSYAEALERRLGVMDATAFTKAEKRQLPIRIFNIAVAGNIRRAAAGEAIGTLMS
jgi:uridylate kinase